MSYYQFFSLKEEPFSTSPDPAYFWLSESHCAALYRLQVAIKLKRGLSVVLGDVGTGKTTLSRRLFQVMQSPKVEFHLIFTPFAETEHQFMYLLLEVFHLKIREGTTGVVVSGLAQIERYLLSRALEKKKTVVLLIDEAQRLSMESLEILRALLNYESHQAKLLQLVLIGQAELLPKLTRSRNFWDRVSLKRVLRPLTEIETEKLIQFRLERAGWKAAEPLFSQDACRLIHQISRGYPRRITRLGHDALELAVMRGETRVNRTLIEELESQEHFFFEGDIGIGDESVEDAFSPFERSESSQKGIDGGVPNLADGE